MNKLLILLIVLVILAVILMLIFGWKGLGFGRAGEGGKDDGGGDVRAVTVQGEEDEGGEEADREALQESQPMEQYADVTVTGSSYFYEGSVVQLDELIEKLRDSGCVVRITDKEAAYNVMEDLINALEQKNITYIMGDVSEAR